MNAKDFFNNRATSYSRVSSWTINEELNAMSIKMLDAYKGDIVLDLGAGTGVLIEKIANFNKKIALDISQQMLLEIKDKSIETIVGDIHKLELPDNYADLIICRQVLHYCDLALAFKNIVRVIKPKGLLHIVQVIDFKNVPEEWDNEWASFRKVSNRKHLRKKEIEKYIKLNNFKILSFNSIIIRDNYSWEDFFDKHNINENEQEKIIQFFANTPHKIKKIINLEIDKEGITYNRIFGFWALSVNK